MDYLWIISALIIGLFFGFVGGIKWVASKPKEWKLKFAEMNNK